MSEDALDLDDAATSLRDSRGRLDPSFRVDRVRLRGRRSVSFDRYLREESKVLRAVSGDLDLLDALDAAPMPPLDGLAYEDLVAHLVVRGDATDEDRALGVAGGMLGVLASVHRSFPLVRIGRAAFDRAEARTPRAASPDAMLRAFVADEIWSLRWAEEFDFATCRAELATRVAIARGLARRIVRVGARRDRAMAEAITAIELLGESAAWRWAMARAAA